MIKGPLKRPVIASIVCGNKASCTPAQDATLRDIGTETPLAVHRIVAQELVWIDANRYEHGPGCGPRAEPASGCPAVTRRAQFRRFSETDTLRSDLKKRSVRGAIFVASSGASELLIRFVAIAVLARLLSPEDFGVVAMVTAITAVIDNFRDLGLSAATVQRRDITHEQVSSLFWINVAVGVTFALLLVLGAPLVARFYDDPRVASVTLGLALVFPLSSLGVQHEALMSRQLRQGELAALRLLANVASLLLAIWLAISEWGYWALVWREVARSTLYTGGIWVLCGWLPGLPRRNVGTAGLVRFGSELSLTGLFTGVIANVDRLLIGSLFGAAPVGLYRQAQQLLLAPVDQLTGPIISVSQPALSALQGEPDRYRRYFHKILFLVSLTTIPLGLFVTIYAGDVTTLLLGSHWSEASVFVAIFGFAAMIRPSIGTSAVVLITCGHSRRFLLLGIVHSVVLAVLLVLGTFWGAEGVAVAHVATTVLLMVPKLHYSFRGTPVTLGGFARTVSRPVFAAMVMGVGLLLLKATLPTLPALAAVAAGLGAGGVLYFATLWLQQGSREELMHLWSDVRGAMRRRRPRGAEGGS